MLNLFVEDFMRVKIRHFLRKQSSFRPTSVKHLFAGQKFRFCLKNCEKISDIGVDDRSDGKAIGVCHVLLYFFGMWSGYIFPLNIFLIKILHHTKCLTWNTLSSLAHWYPLMPTILVFIFSVPSCFAPDSLFEDPISRVLEQVLFFLFHFLIFHCP